MPELNIDKTKKTLGQSIKRPPLSEKLLSKPPYRYLYDIIMEVNNVAGFFNGLFTDEESAQPGKDTPKEIKLSFLQKVIDVVESSTGKSISAKPSKIIAGHEPEKTNELLQILGQALLDKVDSKSAIETVLNGGKAADKRKSSAKSNNPSESREKKSEDKEKSRNSSDATEKEKESRRKHRSKPDSEQSEKDKEKSATNGHASPAGEGDRERKERSESKTRDASSEDKKEHRSRRSKSQKDRGEKPETDQNEGGRDTSNNEHASEEILEQQPSTQTFKRPSSAKGHRRRQVHGDSDGAEDNSSEQVPAASSPGPEEDHKAVGEKPPPTQHKEREKESVALPPSSQQTVQSSVPRPMSSRPAAPRKKNTANSAPDKAFVSGSGGDSTTQIIYDKPTTKAAEDSSDDEDDVIIVTQDTMHGAMRPGLDGVTTAEVGNVEEHGGLVQKILETKKKDEVSGTKTQVTIDKTVVSREQEAIAKRTRELQEKLQTLVKSAAPLKQIMNYVQEDVDTMNKELTFWSSEIHKNSQLLQRETQKTERELGPLYEGLEFLEVKVSETRELIRNKKASVIQNEQTISKLLSRTSAN